jgi:hypothetical protein
MEEVLGQMEARSVRVATSSGIVTTGLKRQQNLCGVMLGDEGYPFSVLFHRVEAEAVEGKTQCSQAQKCVVRRTRSVPNYWMSATS